MKKILCLLLALTCVFSLFACKAEEDEMSVFVQTVAASSATKVTTLYSLTTEGGEVFNGNFTTEIDGENSVSTYKYERYATLEEAADSYIVEISGTVYYKDGKYSEDGENWFAEVPDTGAISIKFDLNPENLGTYELLNSGKTLMATLTAEQAKAVLGADINASGSVSMTVKTNGKYLTSVSVTYKTVNNATVVLDTSYTYNASAADAE